MKILILEDDLTYQHLIIESLLEVQIESSLRYENIFEIMLCSSTKDIEQGINCEDYDLIILDRDSYNLDSFHDYLAGGWSNIISISAVPDYNKLAKNKGCLAVIQKEFREYDKWKEKLKKIICKKKEQTSRKS